MATCRLVVRDNSYAGRPLVLQCRAGLQGGGIVDKVTVLWCLQWAGLHYCASPTIFTSIVSPAHSLTSFQSHNQATCTLNDNDIVTWNTWAPAKMFHFYDLLHSHYYFYTKYSIRTRCWYLNHSPFPTVGCCQSGRKPVVSGPVSGGGGV